MTTFTEKQQKYLFEPKDISTLALFRIGFGAIMLWEITLEIRHIKAVFVEPLIHFHYQGLGWMKPLDETGMKLVFFLMGLLSVLIMLGLIYRVATVLFFLTFTYAFFFEEARYLNHYYLVSLISFLMIFIPAHWNYSLDALIWKKTKTNWVPAWSILLVQFQIGVVYFFGGIAKIKYDWLISAEPMQHWLKQRQSFPFIGQFFDEPWIAYFMSWSGMLLDLLSPFLLLSRKTRPFILLPILVFHVMNDRLFNIGIFPWFMMIASVIFFPADLPKRLIDAIRRNFDNQRSYIIAAALIYAFIGIYFHRKFELLPFVISAIGGALFVWSCFDLLDKQISPPSQKTKNKLIPVYKTNILIPSFILVWIVFQVALPLRHFFIPGDVNWTEEGQHFAWHMMLREKSGTIVFYAYDPATKKKKLINTKQYLKEWQLRKLIYTPDMIPQFAKYVHDKLKREGKGDFQIMAKCVATLNFGPKQTLIDPYVDLAKVTYSNFSHNTWILHHNEGKAGSARK